MGKVAYLDCFAGVSGDMLLGAIVDAGVKLVEIKKALEGLTIKGYEIKEERVKRSFIEATKVTVRIKERKGIVRRWRDIEKVINKANLPKEIKKKGIRIFKHLFEAEGTVHGQPYDEVHLHELGAIDCLIDVFGSLLGFHLLGIKKVYCSPVNLGSGTIKTEHGIMPVPSPAVIELLKGRPVYSSGPNHELTTPTGAAIIREVVSEFGALPEMSVISRGYGAGTRDFEGFPNTLRIIVGEKLTDDAMPDWQHNLTDAILRENGPEMITVIETNIDDMNPQIYEYLFERLFDAGAIDVFLTQVIMKKGRPGNLLTVLCDEKQRFEIASILFRETTTLGVRYYKMSRMTLKRETKEGRYGDETVRVKVAIFDGKEKTNPEYEDCKRIAIEKGIPLIEVMKGIRNGQDS